LSAMSWSGCCSALIYTDRDEGLHHCRSRSRPRCLFGGTAGHPASPHKADDHRRDCGPLRRPMLRVYLRWDCHQNLPTGGKAVRNTVV
jgi:hypothetical protein